MAIPISTSCTSRCLRTTHKARERRLGFFLNIERILAKVDILSWLNADDDDEVEEFRCRALLQIATGTVLSLA